MDRVPIESTSITRSSLDAPNAESPPLYSCSSLPQPSDIPLSAPDPKATPDKVRDFLVRLLIQNRGLDADHARRVAAKWTMGTGRELSSYPPLLYAEIFGTEDAWMVYKEAKVFIRQEKMKNRPLPKKYIGLAILSAPLSSALTSAILAGITNITGHEIDKVISIILSLPLGLGWPTCILIGLSLMLGVAWLTNTLLFWFGSTDLEHTIEAELREGLVAITRIEIRLRDD